MIRPKDRVSQIWVDDRGLSILLVVLVVTLFSVPLRSTGKLGAIVLAAVFSLLLITGVATLSKKPWVAVVAAVIAVVAMTAEWMGDFVTLPGLETASAFSSLLFTALLATVVLAHVLRAGPITIHRIMGAAAAYLLLGFTWGELYHLVVVFFPGAFHSAVFNSFNRPEFYYFSFVTLTTVGYGDITPVHPLARSLANLEALTGQLFPAILIGRLVAMQLIDRGGTQE